MRAIIVLMLLSMPASAAALRCDGRLVTEGDHAVEVQRRCGEPYWVEVYPQWIVRGEFGPLEQRVERRVEAWYYNFGSNRLLRRLVFVNDRLTREDTLGYGVGALGGDCNLDTLTPGLSTGEIVARCGLPESRDARYAEIIRRDGAGNARERLVRLDDWVYDPGHGRDLRLLKFVDGDLDRIERLDK